MESAARDDFALPDAADSTRDPFGFVSPEPLSMSSSDDESGVSEKESPSQYRMEQLRKRGSDDSDGQSSSADEDVEIPEDEIPPDDFVDEIEHVPRAVLEKKAALRIDCDALMRKMHNMSQHLKAVMRLQTQHHREKRLRDEYDAEEGDPGPSTLAHRARAAEFTLPRKKQRDDVPPTPDSDDDDLESMSSHASSSRKKVQPEVLFVASKDIPKLSDAEIRDWLRNYAIEQMTKACPYIDKNTRETDLGGMKLAHVRLLSSCWFLLSVFTFFLQAYKSRRADGFYRAQDHCPFCKKFGCLLSISVKTYRNKVMLFVSGEHTPHSHKGGKGAQTVKQQVSIRTAVRCAPLQTGSAVLANLKNFSPDRRVRGDKHSKRALDRMVRTATTQRAQDTHGGAHSRLQGR